jgi:hydrogenase maturation protein HypF
MNARDPDLHAACATRVLAVGAWLKNTACLVEQPMPGDPVRVAWSDLHGDLGTPDARLALERSIEALLDGPRGRLHAIAHDLHPDFHSTLVALETAGRLGVPAVAVQHHHAHIAVTLAEAGHAPDEAVIGLALDGAGFGPDGTAWGGELLWVRGSQCRRLGHLEPLALPGGDAAAREPWRMAASVLHAAGRGDEIERRFAPSVGEQAARSVRIQLERQVNAPISTSAGRWFDAAAGALGLCVRQRHEAEAAQQLERLATQALAGMPADSLWARPRPVAAAPHAGPVSVALREAVLGLFDLPPDGAGAAAARFHLAMADALSQAVLDAAARHAVRRVALGGGCFFNALLAERIVGTLKAAGLEVLRPSPQGTGDSGLALGQAWVAAQRLACAPPNRRSFGCITVGVGACA